jgi:hypothetical protein
MRIDNPVSGYFASRRREGQRVADAEAAQEKVSAKARALAQPETDRYLSNTTSPPQTQLLDTAQAAETKQAEDFYQQAGMEKTDMMSKEFSEIQLNRQLQEAVMHENTWKKSIQSLGFTQEETLQLLTEYRLEAKQEQEAFTNLMQQLSSMGMIMMVHHGKKGNPPDGEKGNPPVNQTGLGGINMSVQPPLSIGGK